MLTLPRSQYRRIITSLPQPPSVSDATTGTPWIVSIRYDAPAHDKTDRHTAVGALISPNVVVTAAHVFDDRAVVDNALPVQDVTFSVCVGSADLTGGTRRAIRQVVPHPQFTMSPRLVTHDVAVVILDDPVEQAPLALDPREAMSGDTVHVFGWPKGSDGTGILQQATTSLIDPLLCRFGGIAPGDLCAANLPPEIAISGGYSGGPVVRIDDQGRCALVGIVSHGAGALAIDEAGAPGIFTSAALNENFLQHAIDGTYAQETSHPS